MSWLISQALMKDYENSHCSQAQAVEFSEESCSDGKPSAPSNTTRMPPLCWSAGKTTIALSLSRFGMMCRPLTESHGEELLTWYLADSHAKTSAYKESEQGLTAKNLECGDTWRGSLAKYSPDSHSLKTVQNSLIQDLTGCFVTLPKWGLMRNGEIYQRPHWERHIYETAPGLLPTPRVSRGFTNPTLGKKRRDCLTTEILGEPILGMRPVPEYVEWMMNFPIGWTELNVSAMPKFQSWRQQHGECSAAFD